MSPIGATPGRRVQFLAGEKNGLSHSLAISYTRSPALAQSPRGATREPQPPVDTDPLTPEEHDQLEKLFAPTPWTPKEQALFAAGYACSELGRVLARDSVFRLHVESIQRGEQTIDSVARCYFPDAAKRRTIIAAMIELAIGEHSAPPVDGPWRWLLVEQPSSTRHRLPAARTTS